MKVLVSRGADLATVAPRVRVPAAQHLLRDDPHGVPAGRAARLRPPGQRQRDRGPARERRSAPRGCCGRSSLLSRRHRAAHLLHHGGGAARRQPGLPRDRLRPRRQQGAHRRARRASSTTTSSRRNMVLYVSDIPAETGEWQDVFIYDVRDPQQAAGDPGARGPARHRPGARQTCRAATSSDGVDAHLRRRTTRAATTSERFSAGEFPLPFDEFFPKLPAGQGRPRDDAGRSCARRSAKLQAQGKGPQGHRRASRSSGTRSSRSPSRASSSACSAWACRWAARRRRAPRPSASRSP